MSRSKRARSAPATALGIIAVILAAGGGAYAASSGEGAITACVKHHGGGLYRARHCARHDASLSWNARGPQGPSGRRGDTGAQGFKGDTGAQGPGGPQGPAGAQGLKGDIGAQGSAGPQGPAGSALGYAHVLYDGISGTASFDAAKTSGMGSATVTRRPTSAFCLSGLPFTPHNATVTIDYKTAAGLTISQVEIEPPGTNARDCAAGENVEVVTGNPNTNTYTPQGFYVTFN